MKIEIENLKALIHGRNLTAYQMALAMNEWSKLQLYIGDLEKLNIPDAMNQVCGNCGKNNWSEADYQCKECGHWLSDKQTDYNGCKYA